MAMTRSSQEHIARCLTKLAFAFPGFAHGKDKQTLQAYWATYFDGLCEFPPRSIELGCQRAADECETFPSRGKLRKFVVMAANDRDDVPAIGTSDGRTSDALNACLNEALSYLPNCYFREFDRRTEELGKEWRRSFMTGLTEFWYNAWLQIGLDHRAGWTERRDEITRYVDGELGSNQIAIMDAERAASDREHLPDNALAEHLKKYTQRERALA